SASGELYAFRAESLALLRELARGFRKRDAAACGYYAMPGQVVRCNFQGIAHQPRTSRQASALRDDTIRRDLPARYRTDSLPDGLQCLVRRSGCLHHFLRGCPRKRCRECENNAGNAIATPM